MRLSFREALLTTSLAYLPILLFWAFKEFIQTRPFWIYYDHIETLYYYTSMELAEGRVPHNIDNPGSLVQLVGVLLIKVLGSQPEQYPLFQHIAHIVIVMLSFFASFLLVRFTLSGVGRLMSIVCVWMFYIFPVALMYFQVWGPESFYYPVGALFIIALFRLFDNASMSPFNVLLVGMLLGALLSIKFTFFAWLPGLMAALFVSGCLLNIATACLRPVIALVGVVLGFLIITFPMREGYPYMFGWLQQLALNEGMYGRGEHALPDISAALAHWKSFFMGSKAWLVTVVFMVVYAIVSAVKHRNQFSKVTLLVGVFVVVSIIFSLLFIIRSYAQRYMLPVGLCGVMVAILFAKTLPREAPQIFRWSVFGVFLSVLLKTMYIDLHTHKLKTQQGLALHQSVKNKIDQLSSEAGITTPVVIYGWRVPTPSFSLRQHARLEHHQRQVDVLFPNQGHYTPWPKEHTFRLPYPHTTWDYAIIRQEYLNVIPINSFVVQGKLDEYLILTPER